MQNSFKRRLKLILGLYEELNEKHQTNIINLNRFKIDYRDFMLRFRDKKFEFRGLPYVAKFEQNKWVVYNVKSEKLSIQTDAAINFYNKII